MTAEHVDESAIGAELRTVYQPIVTLPERRRVGYEALTRWPGQPDRSPGERFAEAVASGSVDELDARCIEGAASDVFVGNSFPGMLLCINAEPSASPFRTDTVDALRKAADRYAIAVELTERALLSRPHVMLRKVIQLRRAGIAVALDDIGAQSDSLAMLDIIAPDIVKLDLRLVQRQPNSQQARTLAAVLAHQERTDAVVVAEGVETDEHFEQALAYGAQLAQGRLFGPPGPMNGEVAPWGVPVAQTFSEIADGPSVFDQISAGLAVRTVRTPTLRAFTRQIERLALAADSPPIVLTTVQHSRYFTGTTREIYGALAMRCPLVAVFGRGLSPEPVPGIRGVQLQSHDPLCHEWAVVILGPDTCAALVGRECQPCGHHLRTPESARRFDMAITFDRRRVTEASRKLIDRMG